MWFKHMCILLGTRKEFTQMQQNKKGFGKEEALERELTEADLANIYGGVGKGAAKPLAPTGTGLPNGFSLPGGFSLPANLPNIPGMGGSGSSDTSHSSSANSSSGSGSSSSSGLGLQDLLGMIGL